ncbi:MAG: hypothetical protein ACR2HJ_12815 [Fimbriimonadales bacterium]
MNPIKLGITIFVVAIVATVLWGLLGAVISLSFKLAVLAAVGFVVYGLLTGNKALGGGRGRLP